jgi:hypothetical protein
MAAGVERGGSGSFKRIAQLCPGNVHVTPGRGFFFT